MIKRFYLLIARCCVICIAVALIVACAPREASRRHIDRYEGPLTVEVLRSSVGFRGIKSAKALMDLKIIRDGQHSSSFSGVFGYQSPDSIKAGIFGPFGMTAAEVLSTKDLLQVYIPSKETIYEMNNPAISLSSFAAAKFSCSMKEDSDTYQLYVYEDADMSGPPVIEYVFDKTYLLNRKVIVYNPDGEVIRIEFIDFDGTMPERIRLFFGRTEIEVFLHDIEYDSVIPSEFFGQFDHAERNIVPLQVLVSRLLSGKQQ